MGIAFEQTAPRFPSVNATQEPAIHWPSAIIGLLLAVLVVVGVSWLASPRPVEQRASPVTAPAPTLSVPAPAPTPIPAPTSAPTVEPVIQRFKIAFTNGLGANLRAKPGSKSQRIKTLPEGSAIEALGETETVDGLTWRSVRDSAGATGWIVATFAAPVS